MRPCGCANLAAPVQGFQLVAKVPVLHFVANFVEALFEKCAIPTKVATKVHDKVFSTADFCNSL